MIINKDFRKINLPTGKRILTITDPPYNINFKYGAYNDNLSEESYIKLLSEIPKPCVIIHYPEETFKYVLPAMGECPKKIFSWCYHNHMKNRNMRLISFFGIAPDTRKRTEPYRNPNDKRVKKLMETSKGRPMREWFIIEQVKNVSPEYQGYSNQIPEEIIKIILQVCEGQFDIVFDPFCGSGTTAKVSKDMGYPYIVSDIDKTAIDITTKRIS